MPTNFTQRGRNKKITKLPVDFDTLFELAGQKGWLITTYQAGRHMIQKLGHEDVTKRKDSFTSQCGDGTKVIFYKDGMSLSKRVFLIAHEIGHILLDHTSSGILGESPDPAEELRQEMEADNFAYAFLAPPIILRACHIRSANEIERVTLLEKTDAEIVLSKIRDTEDAVTEEEKEILEQFNGFTEEFVQTKRNYFFKRLFHKPALYVSCLILALVVTGGAFTANYLNAIPASQSSPPAVTETPPAEETEVPQDGQAPADGEIGVPQPPADAQQPDAGSNSSGSSSGSRGSNSESPGGKSYSGGGSSGSSGGSYGGGSAPAPQQPQAPAPTYQPPAATPYQAPATPQPTPPPTQAPVAAKAETPQGQTVWLARTGTKYHIRSDCSYIAGKTDLRTMDISTAIAAGYGPCSRCTK